MCNRSLPPGGMGEEQRGACVRWPGKGSKALHACHHFAGEGGGCAALHAWQGRSTPMQASQQGCTGASASLHIVSQVPAPGSMLQVCMATMTIHGLASLVACNSKWHPRPSQRPCSAVSDALLSRQLPCCCSRLLCTSACPASRPPCGPLHATCIGACLEADLTSAVA